MKPLKSAKETLPQLLESSDRWLEENGGFMIAAWTKQGTARERFFVTDTELSTLHPGLPDSLRALLAWIESEGRLGSAEGTLVRATLKALQNTSWSFEDGKTKDLRCSYIHDVVPDKKMVKITGDMFTVSNLPGPVFATSAGFTTVPFRRTSIDKQYPGWDARLSIGKELGVDTEELMHSVFSKTLSPSADMTAITEVDSVFKL